MPNGGYDKMNKDGNFGKGLLGAIIAVAGAAAVHSSNETKKRQNEERKRQEIAQKRAELNQRLNNVRYELSKKKSNIFREAWYTPEIKELERQEAEILRQLKELGG